MSRDLVDLSGFDLNELKLIEKQVQKAISNYDDAIKAKAMEEVSKVLKEYDVELSDIVNKRVKPEPKYTDGKSTWTGRGRMPKWIEHYINSGGKLEDLLIK